MGCGSSVRSVSVYRMATSAPVASALSVVERAVAGVSLANRGGASGPCIGGFARTRSAARQPRPDAVSPVGVPAVMQDPFAAHHRP